MNTASQLEIEALDQVTGGCGHRHIQRAHQTSKSESSQQTGQMSPSADDLAIIMAGARIKF